MIENPEYRRRGRGREREIDNKRNSTVFHYENAQ